VLDNEATCFLTQRIRIRF